VGNLINLESFAFHITDLTEKTFKRRIIPFLLQRVTSNIGIQGLATLPSVSQQQSNDNNKTTATTKQQQQQNVKKIYNIYI
jgi:hypothetical protein